ncbi:MAG: transposase [Chloroflexi bacterium]|nr:transposase [Chloroflexota bacterium]
MEPVFGQIKELRGMERFLRRGLRAVRSEWRLMCTTHNPLKLFRSGRAATPRQG